MLGAESKFSFDQDQSIGELSGWISEIFKLIPVRMDNDKLVITRTGGLE